MPTGEFTQNRLVDLVAEITADFARSREVEELLGILEVIVDQALNKENTEPAVGIAPPGRWVECGRKTAYSVATSTAISAKTTRATR